MNKLTIKILNTLFFVGKHKSRSEQDFRDAVTKPLLIELQSEKP